MSLQTIQFKGLIVLRDSLKCSGERLLLNLALRASTAFPNSVHIFLLDSCLKILEQRYAKPLKSIVKSSFTEVYSLSELRDQAIQSNFSVVFIDLIDEVFLGQSIDSTLAQLRPLFAEDRALVIRVHAENIAESDWNRLSTVARTTCTLAIHNRTMKVGTTITYNKSGKQQILMNSFDINEELRLTCKPYTPTNSIEQNDQSKSAIQLLNTTFDIGLVLRESERQAKNKLQLPFHNAQKQDGLVGLNATGSRKVRVGGRIIYTPDEADDADESDPDDDLEI